ncbi:S1 family peptidase [Rhodococcus tukisamuensis]|uniref:Trypsin n=1 Tax=Rhodococcus tukisamuensis TaxID=168276 RepID=A0A1G6TDH1_9NOCA|nr:S1 family peptidase [Rhodococcus tukisamuensis]SDD27130.1 Trypsin [Rhodococcus tukisamuensis]
MRHARARRAALIGSAALLLLAPTLAHAEPATAASATTALPPELVTAIQRDLGLTAEQYLTQADTGQQLVAFANTLREKYPDAFAGAWLDPSGNPLVGLADGAGKDDARKAVEDQGYLVKDVPNSERALDEELNRAHDWVATLPAPLAKLIGAAGIDVVNNRMAIQVSDTAQNLGLQLPDFLAAGDAFVIPLPDLGSLAPPPIDPPGGLASQGGDSFAGTDMADMAGKAHCSLGFNGTDAAGEVVTLTAGHCDPNAATAGTPAASVAFDMSGEGVFGDRFGTFARSVTDDVADYSVIRIDDHATDRFRNNLIRVPGASSLAIDGTADPVVGAPVCKSGRRTGYRCGTVTSTDFVMNLGYRISHTFAANICTIGGDSGGPIVTGTQALGITSVSNFSAPCSISRVVASLSSDAPWVGATPINTILRDNPGLSVNTH